MTNEEFALNNQLSIDEVNYLTRHTPLMCPKCNNAKRIVKTKNSKIGMHLKCKTPECHHLYGTKRPDHSAVMAEKAKDRNSKFGKTLIKKGEFRNKEVNSIEFKRTVLSNKGVDVSELHDEDVCKLHSKLMSTSAKSTSARISSILSRIETFDEEALELLYLILGNVTQERLENMDSETFAKFFKTFHGLCTIYNNRNSLNSKSSFFKHETLTNLQHNSQHLTTVRVRSSWEASAISLFEKHKIPWSYEELKILCKDGTSLYIPDFKIKYNSKIYLIELKGSFYRTEEHIYAANKLAAGYEYATSRGWEFLLIMKEPKTMKFLNESINLGEKYDIC